MRRRGGLELCVFLFLYVPKSGDSISMRGRGVLALAHFLFVAAFLDCTADVLFLCAGAVVCSLSCFRGCP